VGKLKMWKNKAMRTIPITGWKKSMAVVSSDTKRDEVAIDFSRLASNRLWLTPKAAQLLIKQLKLALKDLPKKKKRRGAKLA